MRHPYNGHTLAQCYALTMEKKVHLERMGYTVITMWQHDFYKNQDMQAFTVNIEPRLDPRDSFFGGRTNASKLHYAVKDGEQLKYVDFTSLYPTVSISFMFHIVFLYV